MGPFKIDNFGQNVVYNPWSWNKFANVLFLESPAGVGFSYSLDGNTTVADDDVSLQNYNALLSFLVKFPEYRSRDLFLTGESYAGVYIPTLAVRILGDPNNFPNFRGVAIGNGALDFPNNYNTMVPLYYWHGIVRDGLYTQITAHCCGGNIETCPIFDRFQDQVCREMIISELDATNELNMYNLYDVCYYSPSGAGKRAHIERFFRRINGLPQRKTVKEHTISSQVPLCAQTNNTYIYLNRADVRKSLHIPSSVQVWQECSDDVGNHYKVTHFNVIPEFQALIAAKKRILVYNGDVDTACNVIMNQQFLTSLNLTIKGEAVVNVPWRYPGQTGTAVAGFQTNYVENVDFLTVRGSGHFVPEDKPRESQQMIYNFLKQRDFSSPIDF
ncbi:unnamed protein product [Caenorhabditis angaria]|uniref:Carboxypeptidase n=1 Tax=Caenorhabditis angaria TaxID=860376 RepID=A0A9P1MX52_9PELO|nr:unnamed protein product [Caenorhabditis angaria]